ncbi:MAG: magnesium/cobalt transporter CorA [Promethearchaeota archaeon]|nr:MAG: magnesium/cobalt transporter CorA [Candidatus Lokiarchaeota archaeon]
MFIPKIKKPIIKKTKVGLPPGTLIFTGEKRVEKEKITIIDYNEKDFHIKEIQKLEEDLNVIEDSIVRWINVSGINQVNLIEKLGDQFQIHPLVLEDILNPNQRPKIEEFENQIFIVLRMLSWNKEEKQIVSEQISIILTQNCVITFREIDNKIFYPIIERLTKSKGRIRKMGADYLVYSLIDIIVDNYFVILEKIGKKIDEIEEELVENPLIETLHAIHLLKRELILLRKAIWPTRSVINSMQQEEDYFMHNTQIYLRDVYDHIIQIIDTFENYRDIISGMLDIYLSSVSNKMNEIMKVLTIISTIFIPLSFLAGFYGMNFLYMPELRIPAAYPILIIVIIIIALIMIWFFKRKKWL